MLSPIFMADSKIAFGYNFAAPLNTLVVLIFVCINFRGFGGFCPKSQKFVPAKYLILLKPRKFIPAKKIEKNPPKSLGIIHPCDK